MEQRKVLLNCGVLSMGPTSASIGVIVTSMAIEVTTVVTFEHVPWGLPWYLYFPVSTANGRLVQCAVLHNALHISPTVTFTPALQTVVMGPCVPQKSTLVFTLVSVYVPSFRQNYIAHLHMGTPTTPCLTTIRIRNMLAGSLTCQVRDFNGHILSSFTELETVVLQNATNYKLNVFLSGFLCFGIEKPCWVSNGRNYWLFSQEIVNHAAHIWVLKPPLRDINFLSYYVSVIDKPPADVLQAEPQELMAIAAQIICNRDVFFDCNHCVTLKSDAESLVSLGNKMYSLEHVDCHLLTPWLECADWSWRLDIATTPHVAQILAFLGLYE